MLLLPFLVLSVSGFSLQPLLDDFKSGNLKILNDQALFDQLNGLANAGNLFFADALVYNLGDRLQTHGIDVSKYDLRTSVLRPSISPALLASAQSLRKQYLDNHNVIYLENFFTPDFYRILKQEASRLWDSGSVKVNCNLDGRDRMGGFVPLSKCPTSFYSLLFSNEEMLKLVSAVASGNTRNFFPSDFPIELRQYGKKSRGMPCHSDLQMYADLEGDLEIVVTMRHEDSSQCEISWWDLKGIEHRVRPAENSLTIVKPNSAIHCVSSTAGGEREILKFILVSDYRKPRGFQYYTENECDLEKSPNARAIAKRSKPGVPICEATDSQKAGEL